MGKIPLLEKVNINELKETPDYSKYADERSWDAAFSNLKGLQKKSKVVFDKVIGMIYSISNPTDDDITYIVNKTNDHSKIFDRFDSFYDNPKWMEKFGNVNEAAPRSKWRVGEEFVNQTNGVKVTITGIDYQNWITLSTDAKAPSARNSVVFSQDDFEDKISREIYTPI